MTRVCTAPVYTTIRTDARRTDVFGKGFQPQVELALKRAASIADDTCSMLGPRGLKIGPLAKMVSVGRVVDEELVITVRPPKDIRQLAEFWAIYLVDSPCMGTPEPGSDSIVFGNMVADIRNGN